MEDRKIRGSEDQGNERFEYRRIERLEGWRIRGSEDWRIGRSKDRRIEGSEDRMIEGSLNAHLRIGFFTFDGLIVRETRCGNGAGSWEFGDSYILQTNRTLV